MWKYQEIRGNIGKYTAIGLAPIYWTRIFDGYSWLVDPFVFHRRAIAQSAVEPFWVIEGFDVIEDGQLGLVVSLELLAMERFGFEGAPERFHVGVVVTVAFSVVTFMFKATLPPAMRVFRGRKESDILEALAKAGSWLDVSKAPSFEETQKVVSRGKGGREQESGMFPVHAWQHAYTNYRCYVRIYAYSEHSEAVKACAKQAMIKIIGIEDETFYTSAERARS